MIEPFTIQDPSKPLKVTLLNKKHGQSFFATEQNVNSGTSSFGLPSITFSSKAKTSGIEMNVPVIAGKKKDDNSAEKSIIIAKKNVEDEDETVVQAFSIPPLAEIVCFMYILYGTCMGIGVILFSSYMTEISLLFCPLFIVAVGLHACLTLSMSMGVLGIGLIAVYPVIILVHQMWLVVVYIFFFMCFCLGKVFYHRISMLVKGIIFLFVVCSIIGVLVYQVYPRSIHGLHAAFLCNCMLACTSVLAGKKISFKVECVSHADSINVLAS